MGTADVNIKILGSYNGRAVEKATQSLEKLNAQAALTGSQGASSLAKWGTSLLEQGAAIENVGYKMENMGQRWLGVSAVLAAAGAASFGMASQFESSMSRVTGALDDPTANMDDLRQLALDTGQATIFSASQAGDAMEELAKGGLTAADIQGGALASTMDLAAAGNLELATSANTVVQAMGAFGLSASQTGEAANALAGAAAASSADVSDLTMGLSQASAQAHSAGWSIQDTTAVLGGFADAGIKGSDAGTSLKTMLQRLAAPTENAADMIAELGINVRDSDGIMFDAAGVAEELQNKLGGLSSAEKDAAMQTIFGSDASRAALVMTNLGREGVEKYTAATNDQTSAQRLADSQMGDSQRAIEEMNGAIETAAINAGTVLTPAVTDAANAVGGAAQAFSEMDEGTQRAAIGVAGAVAAFGPLMLVGGKYVSLVGSTTKAIGAKTRAMGELVNLVKTDNTELLRRTATEGTFAQKLAVSANQNAKNTTQVESHTKAVTASTKGVSGFGMAHKDYSAAAKVSSTNTLAATTAIQGQTVAAKAGEAALRGIGIAAKTIAPLVVIEAVAKLASEMMAYAETRKVVEDATEGMTTAVASVGEAYSAYTPEVDAATNALQNNAMSAGDCLKSQADLASKMNETWADYGTNSAMVDNYASVIQELGFKGGLTAAEQERLKSAVEGFNETTGSSIGIINGQTGELSLQKDAILQVAEAYKTEARAEAARELYKETTKQLIQDQISLKDATEQLSQAEEGFGLWIGDFPVIADPASLKYHELEQNVGDLTSATESAKTTQDQLLTIMAASGSSFESLDAALESTGANMSDFGDVGEEALAALQSGFDGSLNSIVQTCATQGIRIPSSLADGIASNSGLPADAQGIMFDALVLQMAGGDVEAAAKALGHDIDQGLVAGITESAEMPAAAVGVMSDETIARAKEHFDSNSPSMVMHQLGTDIDLGLQGGITDSSDQPVSAMGNVSQLVQAAIAGLPAFAHGTGSSSGSNLAQAIGWFTGAVGSSAWSLYSSATGGISGTPGAFLNTGGSAAGSFSSAIGNASAYGSGQSLASTANNGLGSVSASGAGANFVQGFAGGFGAVNIWSAAYSVGMSALGAIKSALGIASPSKEARRVGQWFGEGAVIGMQDEQAAIERQSEIMADAMMLNDDPIGGASYSAISSVPLKQLVVSDKDIGCVDNRNGFSAGYLGSGSVHNNYYTLTVGDVEIDMSSVSEFVTLDQVFAFLRKAATGKTTKVRV